jgi:hypothetical protein
MMFNLDDIKYKQRAQARKASTCTMRGATDGAAGICSASSAAQVLNWLSPVTLQPKGDDALKCVAQTWCCYFAQVPSRIRLELHHRRIAVARMRPITE